MILARRRWTATGFMIAQIILSGCDRDDPRTPLQCEARPSGQGKDEGLAGQESDNVLFFYDKGCPDCLTIKNSLLGAFLEKLEVAPEDVKCLDVTKGEVAREVLRLEKVLGFSAPTLAPIIIARGRAYCGIADVERAIRGE